MDKFFTKIIYEIIFLYTWLYNNYQVYQLGTQRIHRRQMPVFGALPNPQENLACNKMSPEQIDMQISGRWGHITCKIPIPTIVAE